MTTLEQIRIGGRGTLDATSQTGAENATTAPIRRTPKLSEAGRITVRAGSRRGKCGQYVGKPAAHQLKTPEITGIPGVSIGGDGGI